MSVNIFFTNWRRSNHLYKIIDETKSQSLIPNIFVIDNASNDIQNKFVSNYSDITVIEKDNSKMCWERWLVALSNPNKYICIMDDDIVFKNKDVLKKCYNYMENNANVDAIGAYGVKYLKQLGYFGSEHTYCKHKDVPVPILKGRFMFVRFDSIFNLNKETELTCDDIKVSSILKTKILPGCLVDSFEDLPQGTESLSIKSYQNIKRDYAAKRYFNF